MTNTARVTPWKAIVAGIGAAIAFAVPIVDDGVKPSEVLGILGAAVTVGGATYWTPRARRT